MTIREGCVYEGRRGERRYVTSMDTRYVNFVRRDWYDQRDAPDAAITLRAFRRWAVREVASGGR